MENKSRLKYYLLGAAALVVIIVIIVLSAGGSKPAAQNTQATNAANTQTSNPPAPTNTTDTSAANPAPAPTPSPATSSAPTSATDSKLIGTWTSSVQGKGMQGSGKITLRGTVNKIDLTSDVNLVVQKVENNIGTGTITFSNSCFTTTVSTPGKADVTNPTQCLNPYSQAANMQVAGNKITYTGKSILGASISLTGTYTDDSMSGTFTRTSSSGTINGTFSLTRKN